MHIVRTITLLIIGLHLSTFTQEGPPISVENEAQEAVELQESVETNVANETSAQEQTDANQDQPEEATPESSSSSTAEQQAAETSNTVEPQSIDSDAIEAQATEPETVEIQTTVEQSIDPQVIELQTAETQSTEPQAFEIPAVPEPTIDEETIIIEEITPESPVGIDTVSLEDPQGNWLFKRIWWERAEERYEKIRLLVDAIWESRTVFFIKRNELDRNVLDPFYLSVGVGQGELQIILSELDDFFEKEREQHGDLTEQERELYETLATEQESLKQLKLDVESIANLDHAIDDALGTLMEQINRVRQLEKQAWDNFKEIAHVLNDTKARELYYLIEGSARNIKNISNYLEQDFLNHFIKIIGEATSHVARVQNNIQAFKEKGVTFKRQSEQLALQKKEQERLQAEQDEADEEEENRPKPKTGWLDWIMSGARTALNYFISIIRLPYDLIFGGRQ